MIMKREYISPACSIVHILTDVLTTSGITGVTGNGGINWGGAGHDGTRTPGRRDLWN